MGSVAGHPVALTFMGRANGEAELLAVGFAFEQKAGARTVPGYLPTLDP